MIADPPHGCTGAIGKYYQASKHRQGSQGFAEISEGSRISRRLGTVFCAKGLRETPGINRYPGFGKREIYKARVVPLGEKLGKSSGYRVIFERRGPAVFCILIFTRHGEYKHEKDLANFIRSRL
ncbi:MAG: hypothetical protein WC840_04385 [Candidatus Peribacteraceae bacterium]